MTATIPSALEQMLTQRQFPVHKLTIIAPYRKMGHLNVFQLQMAEKELTVYRTTSIVQLMLLDQLFVCTRLRIVTTTSARGLVIKVPHLSSVTRVAIPVE